MTDIRALNEQAVRASMEVVARVGRDDLGRPTPCAGWTLADLLGHMTVQHRGFAAAAGGDGATLAHWTFARAGDDAVERYLEASEAVIAAFASAEAAAEFTLPEFGDPAPTFAADVAMGFHFIDYVVHAWDVAVSIGERYDLAPELAGPALAITLKVPNAERRLRPGAAFVPALGGGDNAGVGTLERILLWLGREPGWRA